MSVKYQQWLKEPRQCPTTNQMPMMHAAMSEAATSPHFASKSRRALRRRSAVRTLSGGDRRGGRGAAKPLVVEAMEQCPS
jgi:hypothetical protein